MKWPESIQNTESRNLCLTFITIPEFCLQFLNHSNRRLVEEDGDGLDLPLVDPVERVEVEVEELAELALLELLQLREKDRVGEDWILKQKRFVNL